jgi:flagellar basal-body rod modification protein FlgD
MSTISSVSTATNTGSTSAPDTVANTSQTLNQQDFLQLLVAQMQNQDPMNPQSDTEMASQMAQFTALTQSSQSSASLAMMQANGLVGSTVGLQVDSKTTTSGVVQGVVMNNGTPQITVNGTNYNLSQVTTVNPTVAAQTAAAAAVPSTTATN